MMMHTLCSILMLVVVSVDCQTAPTVKVDLPKTTARSFEGVNYTLTCDFNGDPTPEITWLRNGFVHIASDRFIFTDNNRKMEMINTEHLIHNGLYQCEGKNSAGAIRSSAVTYRTIYWGQNFAKKSDHQSFSDVDGDRFVRLECAPPVGDPPFEHNGGNFFWFKDDESINEKLYTRLLVRNDAGVIIDWLEFNATKTHVGVYTCIYVIEDQYRVHSMNLTVFDGPPRPQKFTLSKGSRTKNSLTMKWVKPATPVDKYEMVIKLLFSNTGDPDRTVEIAADKESVKVENLRSSFVYEFTINSIKDGIKSLSTVVKVQVLADPATLPATTTTTTTTTTAAVQATTTVGTTTKKPTTVAKTNPTTVSKSTKETKKTSTTTESSTSAAPVSPTLRKDLPSTIIPPTEGENYTLSCDFNGTPTPEIVWLRNGFLQTASDRFIFTDNNRNMHMINTNHVFNNGQYQCEGSNSAGRTRSSKLTVKFSYWNQEFPVKTGHQSFVDVDGDRFVRLECAPPVGDPVFERNGGNFFWYKDNLLVSGSSFTRGLVKNTADDVVIDRLEFNATKSSVGTYVCIYTMGSLFRLHSMNLTLHDGPPRPQQFTLKSRTSTSVTMKWIKPTVDIDRYEIIVKLLFSRFDDPDKIIEIASDKESSEIKDLRPSFTYEFTITSIKDGKKSLPTAVKVSVLSREVITTTKITTTLNPTTTTTPATKTTSTTTTTPATTTTSTTSTTTPTTTTPATTTTLTTTTPTTATPTTTTTFTTTTTPKTTTTSTTTTNPATTTTSSTTTTRTTTTAMPYVKPSITINLPDKPIKVKEGTKMDLSCGFNGYPEPNIAWLKDGVVIPLNDNDYEFQNNNGILTLLNTNRKKHDGQYQCEGSNIAGNIKSRVVQFNSIYFDTTFKVASPDKAFYDAEGERFTRFECSPPDAFPLFVRNVRSLYWAKDGAPIFDNGVQKTTITDSKGLEVDRLEFNADSKSVGTYSCLYIHEGIERRHDMKLFLHDGPLRPQLFKIKHRSATFVELKWNKPAQSIDNYKIMIEQLSGENIKAPASKIVESEMKDVLIDGLKPETLYKFTIMSTLNNKESLTQELEVQLLALSEVVPTTATTTTTTTTTTKIPTTTITTKVTKTKTSKSKTTTEETTTTKINFGNGGKVESEPLSNGVIAAIVISVLVIVIVATAAVLTIRKSRKSGRSGII